jgi:anthraniloyl-CoA monooxygenase
MRIAVIGGGPGGLFFAVLMKRADPACHLTVFERNAPDATFGFGVVFPERSLRYLREADPELHAAFMAAAIQWEEIAYGHRGQTVRFGGHVFSGIARVALLRLLRERAAAVGVDLRFRTEAPDLEALDGYDLVVAADGVGSTVRTALAGPLGAAVHQGRSRFIWLGTTKVFDALTFLFAEDDAGWWGIHAYPYSATHSTVIVETDEATWRRAGLDRADAAARAEGRSDLVSVEYCRALFARHLDGAPLLANDSRWATFRTVRCRRWWTGRVVLLGDAAHTAHFSVGSGTRMAMEDAIALAGALRAHGTLAGALAAYAQERQPAVARLQEAAEPSRWWWEHFRYFTSLPPAQFAFHHLSRAPLLSYGALTVRDRRAMDDLERAFATAAGRPGAPAWAQPLALAGLTVRNRIVAVADQPASRPHGAADRAVATPAAAAAAGAGLVLVGEGLLLGEEVWVREEEPVREEKSTQEKRFVREKTVREEEFGREEEFSREEESVREKEKFVREEGFGRKEKSVREKEPAREDVPAAVHAAGALLGVRLRIPAEATLDALVARLRRLETAGVDLVVLDGAVDPRAVRVARGAWPAHRPLAAVLPAWDDPRDDDEVSRGLETARALVAAGASLLVVALPHRGARRGPGGAVAGPRHAQIAQAFTSDVVRHAVGVPTALLDGVRTVGEVDALILAGRADLCRWPALAWPGWRPSQAAAGQVAAGCE